MNRGLFALALFAFGAFTAGGAFAAPVKPALPDKPLPAETAFVSSVTKSLNAEYPTPAAAEKAGYFRYTTEDSTGAISYANLKWNSAADPAHPVPSQLWYDVKGRLIGADFSVPLTASNAASAPKLWGVNPGRWFKFKFPHVHYVLASGNGTSQYEHAVGGKAYAAAGGSLAAPTAAALVKMGKVKHASDVAKVFVFPAQWDMEVWLTPNPLGAFASKNPLVHPSKNAAKAKM